MRTPNVGKVLGVGTHEVESWNL